MEKETKVYGQTQDEAKSHDVKIFMEYREDDRRRGNKHVNLTYYI